MAGPHSTCMVLVDGLPRPEPLRQITPLHSGPHPMVDPVDPPDGDHPRAVLELPSRGPQRDKLSWGDGELCESRAAVQGCSTGVAQRKELGYFPERI